MKALAYAFSAENPHALRNILLVAVTVAIWRSLSYCFFVYGMPIKK